MASSSLNEWPSLSTEHHNDISLHHRKLRDDFTIVNQYLEDNGEISIPKHHFKLLFNSYQKLSEKLSESTMTKTDMKMGIDTTDEQDSVHTTTFTGKSLVEDEVGVHAASFVERPTIEDEDCVHATNAIERSIIEDQDRINATKLTKISTIEDKDRVYATELTGKPTIEHKDRAHDADLIDLPTTKDKNSFSDIDLMEKPGVEDKRYVQDTNLVKKLAVQYEDCVHDTDLMVQLRVGEKDCVHTTDVMDRSTNTTSKASDSGNLVNLPKCESFLEPSIAVSNVARESRRLPLGPRNHRDHLTYRPLHPGEKPDHPSYGVIMQNVWKKDIGSRDRDFSTSFIAQFIIDNNVLRLPSLNSAQDVKNLHFSKNFLRSEQCGSIFIEFGTPQQANEAISRGLQFGDGKPKNCIRFDRFGRKDYCLTCCAFGYRNMLCINPPRCSFCAGNHFAYQCTSNTPKCVLCGESEPSLICPLTQIEKKKALDSASDKLWRTEPDRPSQGYSVFSDKPSNSRMSSSRIVTASSASHTSRQRKTSPYARQAESSSRITGSAYTRRPNTIEEPSVFVPPSVSNRNHSFAGSKSNTNQEHTKVCIQDSELSAEIDELLRTQGQLESQIPSEAQEKRRATSPIDRSGEKDMKATKRQKRPTALDFWD